VADRATWGSQPSRTPRVAVAIVHWGGRDDTMRCLQSVRESVVPAQPAIVLDNGTGVLAERDVRAVLADALYLALPQNVGFAAAANACIRRALAAGADHVLLLNNDAVLLPDCVGELLRVATSAPGIAAVGAKVLSFDDRSRLWVAYGRLTFRAALVELVGRGEPDGPAYGAVVDVDSIPGCALLVSREAIEQVGYLDDAFFAYHEDVDWCTRARARGLRLLFAPAARVAHRGGASLANNPNAAYYLLARNTMLFAYKHARATQWLRLAVTIGGSLAREWVRGRRRGDPTIQRALARGYVDGLLRRDVPYAALGLRPAASAASAWADAAAETIPSGLAG
jgi:GT2 family glycosyltransferase